MDTEVKNVELSTVGKLEEIFRKFIDLKTKPRTKDLYLQTLSKIKQLYDIEQWSLVDISVSWFREFKSTLKASGIATNSIAIHLRNIRAVYNYAIDEDIITLDKYPFRKFMIKTERTRKRSLTIEQLRTLRDYECQEHQVKYRDMFMLIFYLIGINMVDLLHLKEINVHFCEKKMLFL